MYQDKRIALVIPAYNEERLIRPTLEHVPDLVDTIIVVDDASTDNMAAVVQECAAADPRIELIRHETNRGPGAGIITGYKRVLEGDYDIAVVCGGDYQMPLDQIPNLLDPLIRGEADYTKGNRFMRRAGSLAAIPGNMPRTRVTGNMIITILTKIASGFYKVADVVEGFTAINREGLERVDWDRAWPGYGYPMDFLIRLNAYGLRVKDVPRRAIYLPGERQSQIKGLRYALRVSPMLLRGFFWRLWNKYVLWDFHPLVFFYGAGMTLLPVGFLWGLFLVWQQWVGIGVSGPRAILCALLIITGLQFLLFAMLFDMEEGK
ncbi:MAG: glycosyltransferase family 2 protein [Chloroflexi bacterium]|nr:glycosyltransferase family 2 protein [Chloroflexota bacterium]MBU1751416.1 glycosyltransferase family 2 protein [Chloroflexota bacterium]MBU1879489.1 glycosyltransferase family 2 protein [Chloroflexota bacterium]